jgi:hypothetical protein
MNRRSFLGAMLAAAAAPAIVRAQSLMPVRAPSSTAAIVERAVAGIDMADAKGIIELRTLSGVLLASMPVYGDVYRDGLLKVESATFVETGTVDQCIARLPQGDFPIEFRGRGTKVLVGDQASCEAGLRLELGELTAL